MTRPKIHTGKLFAAVTAVYLLVSLFGSALYLVLPPFLCSIGARVHAYLICEAAIAPQGSIGITILAVVANVFTLCMIIFGIVSLLRGKSVVYPLLVLAEILATLLFLLIEQDNAYSHTEGILVNMVYFVWAARVLIPKHGSGHLTKKKKGSESHGKL